MDRVLEPVPIVHQDVIKTAKVVHNAIYLQLVCLQMLHVHRSVNQTGQLHQIATATNIFINQIALFIIIPAFYALLVRRAKVTLLGPTSLPNLGGLDVLTTTANLHDVLFQVLV